MIRAGMRQLRRYKARIIYGVITIIAAIALAVIGGNLIRAHEVSSQKSGADTEVVENKAERGKSMESDIGAILFVRAKSGLDEKELERRMLERKPKFLEIPGLAQKVYGRDEATGDVCGIYFFESKEALAEFGETELAKTIASAYEVIEIRREVYDVLYPLRPERGPLADWNE